MSIDRFSQLSDETKKFLTELREEDVKLLEEGISLVRSIRTVGIFIKWLIVGIIGIVVGTVALWESVIKFLKMKNGT